MTTSLLEFTTRLQNHTTIRIFIKPYIAKVEQHKRNLNLAETAVMVAKIVNLELVEDLAHVDCMTERAITYALDIYPVLSWGITKKVYRLDPDLLDVLTSKDINNFHTVTNEVLMKIPEYGLCVYCPLTVTSADTKEVLEICGFTASLSISNKFDNKLVLAIYYKENNKIIRAVFATKVNGLHDSISTVDVVYCDQTLLPSVIPKLLSVLAYFCSDNISTSTKLSYKQRQLQKRNKGRLQVPEKVSVVTVGEADGDLIRNFNVKRQELLDIDRTVKPHIRRAHWHNYWVGGEGNKKKVLKFIPNTFVNVKDVTE